MNGQYGAREAFMRDGYVVVNDFLSIKAGDEILHSIDSHIHSGGEVIDVDRRDLIATQQFRTIVGENCEHNIAMFGLASDNTRILPIASAI